MTDAKLCPSVDGDGMPWCRKACPFWQGTAGLLAAERPMHCRGFAVDRLCLPAVRAMARDLRAAREALVFLWARFPYDDKASWWEHYKAHMDSVWPAIDAAMKG